MPVPSLASSLSNAGGRLCETIWEGMVLYFKHIVSSSHSVVNHFHCASVLMCVS